MSFKSAVSIPTRKLVYFASYCAGFLSTIGEDATNSYGRSSEMETDDEISGDTGEEFSARLARSAHKRHQTLLKGASKS